MKVMTAQAKISITQRNRKDELEKYTKYKEFAKRYSSNGPKLDPLISKRLQNEKRDIRNFHDFGNS